MKKLFILILIILIIFACSSKEDKLKESFKEQPEEFDMYDVLVNDYYCVLLSFKYDMQPKELYEMLKEYEKAKILDLAFLLETRVDSISSKLSIFVNKYDIDKKTLANIIIDYELLSKEYSGE